MFYSNQALSDDLVNKYEGILSNNASYGAQLFLSYSHIDMNEVVEIEV